MGRCPLWRWEDCVFGCRLADCGEGGIVFIDMVHLTGDLLPEFEYWCGGWGCGLIWGWLICGLEDEGSD